MKRPELVDDLKERRMRPSGAFGGAVIDQNPTRRWMSACCVLLGFSAAALPVRIWLAIGPFQSFSVLDVVLVAVGFFLLAWMLAGKVIDGGDSWLFVLLSIPLALSAASFLWTLDETETIRSIVVYVEALLSYVFVVTFLRGQTPNTIMIIAVAFIVLLIVAGVFMWLGIPYFEPQGVDGTDAGTLVSYYARLSHPYLGRSNNVAGILALYVFPFAAWARYRRSPATYLFAGFIALALLLTLSRGVIVAVLATILIASLVSLKRLVWLLFGVLAFTPILVVSALAIISEVPTVAEHLEVRLSLANVLVRLDILEVALRELGEHPLLGVGAGASVTIDPRLAEGVHNTFLQQLLDFGIPFGTFVGVGLILIPWRLRIIDRLRGSTLVGTSVYLAVFCQMLVFMTQTSFEGSILRIIFYMSIGWCVALIKAVSAEHKHAGSARQLI